MTLITAQSFKRDSRSVRVIAELPFAQTDIEIGSDYLLENENQVFFVYSERFVGSA